MEDKISGNSEYQQAVSEATDILSANIRAMMMRGANADEVYIFIRDEVNRIVNHTNYKDSVTCGTAKGDCSFCCHDTILLGRIEAQYIMKVVREKGIKPNMERVNEQMLNPDIKWNQKACSLLLDENEEGKRLCSIYEERPLICRTHNSNENPANCDRSTDPKKIIAETRASIIDALQMVAVLVGMDTRKPYSSLHETMFYMFSEKGEKMEIMKKELLLCTICKKPHGLRDEDAGSSREMMRVCESCYDNVKKTKQP